MLRSKTMWGGLVGLVSAIAGWATGELELGAAISTATTSILAIFVRHSIQKTNDAVVAAKSDITT